jgi:hypothetical protein
MAESSEIFEKHYLDYCAQLAAVDFSTIADTLGIECINGGVSVPLFDQGYRITISAEGMTDPSGKRPAYGICVILAKYLLLCPDRTHIDPTWISFKDLNQTAHFNNVNYFSSDVERAITTHFSNRLDELRNACTALNGTACTADFPYDLKMEFQVLPRVSLLLLFNDSDDEFPAVCKVLFQKQAESYLDPESLAMTGACLATILKRQALEL